ncbi:carboxyltransferase domain-containing protein [Corynebacterium neomassiliense]|uniref:carboxyltransferase domain-containing protein n=1 Tax=Corynebacterium neomassiliense TaxID=2079482 RepID=UPI001F16EE4A|nr:carboxyltransferase domain-containing protein [Corynebacterium neomassiliense]
MTAPTPQSVPVHRVGTLALLVDLPDLATAMAWHAALSADPLPGQTEVGAAAGTVLVRFSSPTHAASARHILPGFTPGRTTLPDPREVTVDVVYDGEDLDGLATGLGMSTAALVDLHSSTTWVAAFGGFAPGFTYCVPQGDPRLPEIPRHRSPRTTVPAGSVALAGEFSAVYPRTSPGGWQLIGTTTTPFWDAASAHPALLSPGDLVRYRPVTPRAANDAVGNARDAAVLENIGGLALTALVDTVVVVTGAEAPVSVHRRPGTTHPGRPVPQGTPVLLTPGTQLTVGPATRGLRSYVGVRGGVVTAPVLGSASTDLLSGLGPAPLTPGDLVHAGRPSGTVAPVAASPRTDGVLRVVPGPRDDWFPGGVRALTATRWTVSPASNRVGIRLAGDRPVVRDRDGELPSEGMVPGSVQVPPDGLPVLFLRDHAVTGGYPVIATVVPGDLDAAAQLAPGSTVTFRAVDPDPGTTDRIPQEKP